MSSNPGERLTYLIDRHDAITGVSGAWAEFAVSNGAPQLANVIGQSLWNHVTGDTTRQVYRDLLARVRRGHHVTFTYRCDAPALRRFMRMTMREVSGECVKFESVIERTEPRDVPSLFEAASAGSSGVVVRVCSWCKRVHVRETWQEVEVAVERLGLFTGGPPPALTHGMCEDCYDGVMAAGGL